MPYCTEHEKQIWFRSNALLAEHVEAEHAPAPPEPPAPPPAEAEAPLATASIGSPYFTVGSLMTCAMPRHGQVHGVELIVDPTQEHDYQFCVHCLGEWLRAKFPVSKL